jgi:hypothetical protein
MEKISFMETEQIKEHIRIICGQTDLTEDEALVKLHEYNFDYIKVIRNHLGLDKIKDIKIVSVNQEIYKQLRLKLDATVDDFNKRKENNETRL